MMRFLAMLALGAALGGCHGCTGGETSPPPAAASPPVAATPPAGEIRPPRLGTGVIKGLARFKGDAPKLRPTDMSGADPQCMALHPTPPQPESVVVDGGGLRNVVVVASPGLGDLEFPPGGDEPVLDQKGCLYVPHVLCAQKGQTLRIRTSDPVTHNVHGYGAQSFNVSQPKGAADVTVKLKKAEWPPFQVKCDIHPWMNAWVAVLEHPFHAVSGAQGAFEIRGLPPGSYRVSAWHEKYGTVDLPLPIDLGEGQTQSVEFSFQGP